MQFTRWISILLLIVIFLITTISSKRYRRKKKELKESVCECGISSVLNLEHSGGSSEKYPWVVNLMDKKRNLTTFCVGTIISKSLILTSASCLLESPGNNEDKECDHKHKFHGSCFKSRSDIAIGFPIIAETFGIFSRGGVTVKKIMPHSYSTENNVEEGLVLLRMYPAFECESIPPVCLGNHKQVIHWTSGIISGWKTDYFKKEGLNMTGQEVQMTTVHSRNCTKIQGHRAAKQAIMCPLKNESASYCKGYAGAPVVVRMKHRFHLIGIMSKTIIDDDCEKHEIYPLICIQNYLSWIHRQIRKEENIHFDKRFSNRLN